MVIRYKKHAKLGQKIDSFFIFQNNKGPKKYRINFLMEQKQEILVRKK